MNKDANGRSELHRHTNHGLLGFWLTFLIAITIAATIISWASIAAVRWLLSLPPGVDA